MGAPLAAFAPGRVNLIGDHTDYTGGLAMPIAIELGTEVSYRSDPRSSVVELASTNEQQPAKVPVDLPADSIEIAMLLPEWSRHLAGVVCALRPGSGGSGEVTSELPVGAGLSSSASLGVACALALGFTGSPRELALSCRQAEELATGVATGILDQLAIASGIEGHAMVMDCQSLELRHVRVPPEVDVVVVHSGSERTLAGTAYGTRRDECRAAEAEIGPLRACRPPDVDRLRDPLLRRRARHVVGENARVRAFAGAFEHEDLREAGRLMNHSHQSLATDYDVSSPELDQLVGWLQGLDGVFGARLTGAGFGGCAVALARPGALAVPLTGRRHWFVHASAGAHLR